ncbi:MAG: porin [Rhodospirillaceae bacterium]|nr:porin [Rhodospirillaceae bacterium]
MKKILMGTTAIIALASFTSQAAAAEKISLGLGGFQKFYVGKVTRGEPTDLHMDMAAWSNTEVYFKGSTTLDNGVSVSTTIQLEGDADATSIDNSYMTISSDSMGAVSLGGMFGAADAMHVGAPMIGPNGYGDIAGMDGTLTLTANELGGFGDDTLKGVYMSPDFNGVTVGMSYTAGEGFGGASNAKNVPHASSNDHFSAALAYGGEMSGAAVDVSLSHMNDNAGNLKTNAIGVNVGMNGFTFGGSYHDFSGTGSPGNTGGELDGNGYDLGVSYETGAVSVAATYMNSTNDGSTAAGENKDTMWNLGVSYDLGAGVGLVAQYYSAKADAEAATAVTSKAIIAGIEVSF